MTDRELVEQFIAKRGVKRIGSGRRSMPEAVVHMLAHSTDTQRLKAAVESQLEGKKR